MIRKRQKKLKISSERYPHSLYRVGTTWLSTRAWKNQSKRSMIASKNDLTIVVCLIILFYSALFFFRPSTNCTWSYVERMTGSVGDHRNYDRPWGRYRHHGYQRRKESVVSENIYMGTGCTKLYINEVNKRAFSLMFFFKLPLQFRVCTVFSFNKSNNHWLQLMQSVKAIFLEEKQKWQFTYTTNLITQEKI